MIINVGNLWMVVHEQLMNVHTWSGRWGTTAPHATPFYTLLRTSHKNVSTETYRSRDSVVCCIAAVAAGRSSVTTPIVYATGSACRYPGRGTLLLNFRSMFIYFLCTSRGALAPSSQVTTQKSQFIYVNI